MPMSSNLYQLNKGLDDINDSILDILLISTNSFDLADLMLLNIQNLPDNKKAFFNYLT